MILNVSLMEKMTKIMEELERFIGGLNMTEQNNFRTMLTQSLGALKRLRNAAPEDGPGRRFVHNVVRMKAVMTLMQE